MTTQQWDPDTYARNARFVSDLGAGVLELLAPQPGEQILDLGCGDGALTEKLVAAGCRVIAIDSSAEQIGAACARGLDARHGSAETLPFKAEFDAVFSNAVLHWIRDAAAVIASVPPALCTHLPMPSPSTVIVTSVPITAALTRTTNHRLPVSHSPPGPTM